MDKQAEKKKILDQIHELETGLDRCMKKLSDESFLQKAPEHVIQREKTNAQTYREKIEKLKNNLTLLD